MNDILMLLFTFSISLGLTLLLEGVIALVFKMRGRDALLFLLVNLLTNPLVVYLNLLFCTLFPGASVFFWQIPLEIAVFAVEGLLYYKYSQSLRVPWLFAGLANLFSYGTGLILNYFI